MLKIVSGVLSLIAIIGLSGCANPNALTKEEVSSIKFLNDMEIKEAISGKTVVGNSYKYNNKEFIVSFSPDGKYSGTVADGKYSISGKWEIKDNENCMYGDKGKDSCSKYYKLDNKYYSVKGMEKSSEFIIK